MERLYLITFYIHKFIKTRYYFIVDSTLYHKNNKVKLYLTNIMFWSETY